jgi:gamma-glutamyltranspeptidase
MGYTLEANSWGDLGDIQAIMRSGAVVEAVSDSRGRGTARVLQPLPAVAAGVR